MENEILNNEEVIEEAVDAVESVIENSAGKGLKIATGIGGTAVGVATVFAIVKYVAIPAWKKYKSKKAQENETADSEDSISDKE